MKDSEELGYLSAPKARARTQTPKERPMSEQESRRILRQVHLQQQELEGEVANEQKTARSEERKARFLSIQAVKADSDEEDPLAEDYAEEAFEDIELSVEDEKALAMFMPSTNKNQGKNLADIIMAAIREKESGADMDMGDSAADQDIRSRLDPSVVEVYTGVGKYFLHYTSGKIPKAFKIVPTLKNWEEILYLTSPDKWTPQATFAAAKLFSANLKTKQAQRFYNIILLPRVRSDIEEHNGRLNFHLYRSVQKAIYKPAAFFKGILLPLADEGCSPKEAVIMSSILAKSTIPVIHSAVALHKLSQLPYSGPTLLFIKTLLNKKYSLPLSVVDSMVNYFSSSVEDRRSLPVIWHQALLVFVQRYKKHFKSKQKQKLNRLLSSQSHSGITPEIRRELNAQAPMNARQRQQELLRQERDNRMMMS